MKAIIKVLVVNIICPLLVGILLIFIDMLINNKLK